ncbi:MAG: DNA-3-methyladenine glycosylase I [candidate division KSB1 bacterium]|jgi:DNA-3-methyladenine glycosylase I|nr:DNA-3-methyladenine glycosylase I [candidate division KSB1 bacterium]
MSDKSKNKSRCFWTGDDPLMIAYHDDEWGYPVHDDWKLFEYLILDAFQAGLSWRTILHKRENFRAAFDNFDAAKIAKYGDGDIERLLNDAGIVRNRLKIHAAINNAQRFLEVQKEFGSFDRYIWQFTEYKTLRNPKGVTKESMPVSTPESDAMSADLKKRGFKFVGTTICYAFMQAIGMVDDHVKGCFRHHAR